MDTFDVDGLRPDVREYLLRWKEYTYTIALMLAASAWLTGQIRFARLCAGETIALGFLIGLMDLAAALAQILSVTVGAGMQQQMSTLALTFFCCVCPLGLAISQYLPVQILLFGFAGGAAVFSLMREILAVRRLRTQKSNRCLMTAALGAAGGLSTIAYPLLENGSGNILPCVTFLLAVGALGIHLKYRKNPPTPLGSLPLKDNLEQLAQQLEPQRRVENGIRFLVGAVGGAVMVFVMPTFWGGSAFLLLLIIGLCFGSDRVISVKKTAVGGFAAALCGVAVLWYPIGAAGLIGVVLGMVPVCCRTECAVNERDLLFVSVEVHLAILVGAVLAGLCLSIAS